MTTLDLFVLLCSVLAVVSAGFVAFVPNILHAAIALVFTLIAVAGFYGALGADFLAGAQFVIYIGATIIVIVFAIMMTPNIYQARFLENGKKYLLPAVLSGFIFAALAALIKATKWANLGAIDHQPITRRLGEALTGPYVVVFEFMAVLLLIGLVGAVVVARQDRTKS